MQGLPRMLWHLEKLRILGEMDNPRTKVQPIPIVNSPAQYTILKTIESIVDWLLNVDQSG